MPKYLFQASYNAEGAKGVMKDGGSGRRTAVEQLVKGMGGRLEAIYFAFGDVDAFVIADVPGNGDAAAAALAANASGVMHVKTTVLLSPEEMDQATKKAVNFRPPGR
ncbi:MAG: GYD domain protein [Candidatus Rokuibacteriota bacterium]|nr:MAG: GYD domain protein [Candidatus Rokubacteria bacterium]